MKSRRRSIETLIDREATAHRPVAYVSERGKWVAVCARPRFGTWSGRAVVSLSGTVIDARSRARIDAPSECSEIVLIHRASGHSRTISSGERSFAVGFSHDESCFAYVVQRGDDATLHLFDCEAGASRALTGGVSLASTLFSEPSVQWLADRPDRMLVSLLPDDGGEVEPRSSPSVVRIVESLPSDASATGRTTDTHAGDALGYCTVQLGLIDLDGSVRRVGEAGAYRGIRMSPDGRYLLARRPRPTPNRAPMRWPVRTEVLDLSAEPARVVFRERAYSRASSGYGVPQAWHWHPHRPATLVAARERKRGGVRILARDAPFTARPRALATTRDSCLRFAWTTEGALLVHEADRRAGIARLVARGVDERETWTLCEYAVGRSTHLRAQLWDGALVEEDPGDLQPVPHGRGHPGLVTQCGSRLFLTETTVEESHASAHLHAFDFSTGARTRLYTTRGGAYERIVRVLDDGSELLTCRESPQRPASFALVDVATGEHRALPSVSRERSRGTARTERFSTRQIRDDLLVHVPRGPRAPLPFLIWLLPTMGAPNTSYFRANRHVALFAGSPLWALFAGYGVAVYDGPRFNPVSSKGRDLAATLAADVEEVAALLVREGLADDRLGLVGHCFGAYAATMTLAHSTRFRAGVAVAGRYNLATTPFGGPFTAYKELKDAPELYVDRSPVSRCSSISAPLLLVHGAQDTLIPAESSERMFEGLSRAGSPCRYVSFEHERHVFTSRAAASVFAEELIAWCDRHVAPLEVERRSDSSDSVEAATHPRSEDASKALPQGVGA